MFVPPASLVLSVSLMFWHLFWGTQSSRCYCHIQGDLAWGPPHWCQVPCGCRCRCIQEARVTGTTSRGTTRWSGAAGSVASAMGLGSATLPLLFPWFHRLYVKNPLTFTCTTLCMSGVLMCWVEKNLVCMMLSTSCRLTGRDKGSVFCHHNTEVTLLNFSPQAIRFIGFCSTSTWVSHHIHIYFHEALGPDLTH